MTFTLKCPTCGHSLGHAHVGDSTAGEEYASFNIVAKTEPRVHPKKIEHPEPKKEAK